MLAKIHGPLCGRPPLRCLSNLSYIRARSQRTSSGLPSRGQLQRTRLVEPLKPSGPVHHRSDVSQVHWTVSLEPRVAPAVPPPRAVDTGARQRPAAFIHILPSLASRCLTLHRVGSYQCNLLNHVKNRHRHRRRPSSRPQRHYGLGLHHRWSIHVSSSSMPSASNLRRRMCRGTDCRCLLAAPLSSSNRRRSRRRCDEAPATRPPSRLWTALSSASCRYSTSSRATSLVLSGVGGIARTCSSCWCGSSS